MSPYQRPGPTRVPRVLVALGLVAVLVSCGSGGEKSSADAAPKATPSPTARVDPAKQNKAAIEATLATYAQVIKSSRRLGRASVPVRRLRTVVAGPYATKLTRQLTSEGSHGLVMHGEDVYTTRRISVAGNRATLLTCWDGTGADVVDTSADPDRKVAPVSPNLTTFLLQRSGDSWKITRRTPGAPC